MPDNSSDTAQSRSSDGQRRRRRSSSSRGGRGRPEEQRASSNSGHYNVTRREPKPTGFQKFLSAISFGLLGRTKTKPSSTRSDTRPPRADRAEQRPNRDDRSSSGGQSNRAPREPREPRYSSNPADVTTDRLYVGNLSYDATESDLFELFNGVGQVRNAEVVVNSRTQRSKGFAFVTMTDVEQARRAVAELSNKEFMGRPLQVSGAKPPSKDRDGRDEEEGQD